MVVYGTRPEAVKVAPVVRALEQSENLRPVVVVTGQHREMLDQVNQVFDIHPDYDLNVFAPRQPLNVLVAKVVSALDDLIASQAPNAVLVQGDTTSVAASALAAFNRRVPVFHLEAGLRSGNINSPFPEEANRKMASVLAALHLSPTRESRENLTAEGVDPANIVVTGNTVIDALKMAIAGRQSIGDRRLAALIDSGKPYILVTTHRRENWGSVMSQIASALRTLAQRYTEITFVIPAHLNPGIREVLLRDLEHVPNVLLTEPLPYVEFARTLASAHFVVTDSGGVQEEAPSLGKPVLVLRENTERPEAVTAGTVRLIGTNSNKIVNEVSRLVDDAEAYAAMARAVNPYGDGKASVRAVAAMEQFFGLGTRHPDFAPEPGDE